MQREDVERCTVFSTVVGSIAYGTNIEGSDIDIRGVAIPDDKSYYYGFLNRFEQFEDKLNDQVFYDIRKAFKLISDCNPNMLDLLFVDPKFHKKVDPCWNRVLENKDRFLSKKVKNTYVGYAYAQLKRIKTARGWLLNPPKKKPERSDFGLPEKKLLSKADLGAFTWVLINLLENSVEYLNLSENTKRELKEINFIGLSQRRGIPEEAYSQVQKVTGASDEWMHTMQREQAYINAKRHWGSYTQWKDSRNKKRATLEAKFGYDTKHASHLVRIMRMGKEILSTGEVIVFRPDRDELKAIRNGAWSYEQIEEYANSAEKEILTLSETSSLPDKPDRNFLDKLCIDTIEDFLSHG